MVAQTVTVQKNKTQAHPCPCGCAPCEHNCCTLDCLVQPRYFCGQLLTDADLTAGLTWSQNKFRLQRLRDGWGVVCGLEVHGDRTQPGSVIVSPGYAVSCCGDDIIVCQDTSLDLMQIIQQPTQPCDTARPAKTAELGRQPASGPQTVDVYIRYREEKTIPATTLGRAACSQAGECDYTRTQETFQLTGKVVPDPKAEPTKEEADRFMEGYAGCLEIFRALHLGEEVDAQWLQNQVRDWMNQNPPHQYLELYDFIGSSNPQGWVRDHQLNSSEVGFMLAQDCRNALLACDCLACEDDTGVLLARVRVDAVTENRRTRYYIHHIESFPPYRRPQRRDCLPAPLGWVNAGEAIWHRVDDAAAILARRGVWLDMRQTRAFDPQDGEAVDVLAQYSDLLFEVGTRLMPLVYHSGQADARVVGVGTAGT